MEKSFLLGMEPGDPDEPIQLTAKEIGGRGIWTSNLYSYEDPSCRGNRLVMLPFGDIEYLTIQDAKKLDSKLQMLFLKISQHWLFDDHVRNRSKNIQFLKNHGCYVDDYEPAADGYIARVLMKEWVGKIIDLD